MAKKKHKQDKADKAEATAPEETPVAEGAEAADEAGESPVVPADEADAPAAAAKPAATADDRDYRYWPVEDDHGSITRLLTRAADREVDINDVDTEHDEAVGGGSNALNLVLLVLIIAATAGGIFQLTRVSSEEALAAKEAERRALEEAHLAEQLAKQKKYGVLRIESEPPQAVVIKDGQKLVAEVAAATAVPEEAPADGAPADGKAAQAPADGKAAPAPADGKAAPAPADDKAAAAPADGKAAPADGAAPAEGDAAGGTKQLVGMTPMNIMNLDIAQTYQIRLEKDGYEPFEFSVAEHLWTKDPTTNEYKFFKMVELTPINCEYWFLYDAKKRREVKFEQKADCLTHFEEAVSQQVSVTECVCKIPPEGVEGAKKEE